MKGQAFIILSLILILFFFLVKQLDVFEFRESYGIESLEFQNLKEEVLKTVQISSPRIENISENLNEFLKFARNSFRSRSVELNAFLAKIYYPNVTPNSNISLNVSIFNLLGTSIEKLNLTFSYDNSSKNFSSVGDGQQVETSFIFNTSSTVNYTLKIFYNTSYENRTEEILIPVGINKSKFIGFFDLGIEKDGLEKRDKIKVAYNLND